MPIATRAWHRSPATRSSARFRDAWRHSSAIATVARLSSHLIDATVKTCRHPRSPICVDNLLLSNAEVRDGCRLRRLHDEVD